jgi:hypothetical protein
MNRRTLARAFGPGLLLSLVVVSTASAQDIDIFEEAVEVENVFELHEMNFDRWIFGNVGNSGTARDRLESLLMLSVGEVDRSCRLTEVQKKRLILAGRGDIKHFLDRLADARKVFDELRHDQNNINVIHLETIPLANSLRTGLFGNDSIFAKSIFSTLETDQAESYHKFLDERNLFRHQAKIRLAVMTIDQAIGMTGEQRQKLIELALRETKPASMPIPQYESQVVMLKISRIPEARFREFLDEPRWKALSRQFQQARGMEAFLKQNGYIDDPESKAGAKATKRNIERDDDDF